MNKSGNAFLWGFLLLVIGLVISIGGFTIKCLIRDTNGLYDVNYMSQCFIQPSTWILISIGIIIGTIGAFICYYSNLNQ